MRRVFSTVEFFCRYDTEDPTPPAAFSHLSILGDDSEVEIARIPRDHLSPEVIRQIDEDLRLGDAVVEALEEEEAQRATRTPRETVHPPAPRAPADSPQRRSPGTRPGAAPS